MLKRNGSLLSSLKCLYASLLREDVGDRRDADKKCDGVGVRNWIYCRSIGTNVVGPHLFVADTSHVVSAYTFRS